MRVNSMNVHAPFKFDNPICKLHTNLLDICLVELECHACVDELHEIDEVVIVPTSSEAVTKECRGYKHCEQQGAFSGCLWVLLCEIGNAAAKYCRNHPTTLHARSSNFPPNVIGEDVIFVA